MVAAAGTALNRLLLNNIEYRLIDVVCIRADLIIKVETRRLNPGLNRQCDAAIYQK